MVSTPALKPSRKQLHRKRSSSIFENAFPGRSVQTQQGGGPYMNYTHTESNGQLAFSEKIFLRLPALNIELWRVLFQSILLIGLKCRPGSLHFQTECKDNKQCGIHSCHRNPSDFVHSSSSSHSLLSFHVRYTISGFTLVWTTGP